MAARKRPTAEQVALLAEVAASESEFAEQAVQSTLIDLSGVAAERDWEPDAALVERPEPRALADIADAEIADIVLIERRLRSSWDEADVFSIMQAGIPPEVAPTIFTRTDGAPMLYRGKVSSIAGPPESAKGWFAIAASRQVLQSMNHVFYIDFEDNVEAILRRMLQVGVPSEYLVEFFHVINPVEQFDKAAEETGKVLWRMLVRDEPHLVVLDGLTQALSNDDLDDNSNRDVVKWFRDLPRIIAAGAGTPAVLIVDHVTKATDSNNRYALGAGQKLAALDGTQFKAKMVKPFAPGHDGRVEIRVTKDRPGGVRAAAEGDSVAEGQVIASMELISVPGDKHEVTVKLWPPSEDKLKKTPDEQIVPTLVMSRMMMVIQSPGQLPPNRSQLCRLVTGNNAAKVLAVNQLLKDGILIERKEDFDTGPLKLYVNPNYNARIELAPKGKKS